MLIKVFCVVSMLSKLGGGGKGLLNEGGGSNRLPGLVTKQQAVEFPQVLTIYIIILDPDDDDDDRAYVCNITPWLTPHFN